MEELLARHRKEQRDLQSQTTQRKKQASKKTRKGVNDDCERLEEELKARQATEVAVLSGNGVPGVTEKMDDLALDNGATDSPIPNGMKVEEEVQSNVNAEQSDAGSSSGQPKKPNRQKARLARRAAEQEELARQAAEEAKNLPDLKQQERERMLEAMKKHGLREKEIRADGHCLYSAVADQLEQLHISVGAMPDAKADGAVYKVVRSAAADYIEGHKEDFIPFLEEPLPDYLHKVRDTGEWGGQLELLALAKTYATNINVLQDFGRVEKIDGGNDNDTSKAMWLGYYKHGFGLGEHYNSLRKAG